MYNCTLLFEETKIRTVFTLREPQVQVDTLQDGFWQSTAMMSVEDAETLKEKLLSENAKEL
jgi:hypothetical protein